eukprot:1778963-Pleurochrysis_carterae.AAC.1
MAAAQECERAKEEKGLAEIARAAARESTEDVRMEMRGGDDRIQSTLRPLRGERTFKHGEHAAPSQVATAPRVATSVLFFAFLRCDQAAIHRATSKQIQTPPDVITRVNEQSLSCPFQ